jgi:hypothetical protein
MQPKRNRNRCRQRIDRRHRPPSCDERVGIDVRLQVRRGYALEAGKAEIESVVDGVVVDERAVAEGVDGLDVVGV